MPAELILQMQKSAVDFECHKFDNFPAPHSAYIAICYADNTTSQQLAAELYDCFVKELEKMGCNESPPPCGSKVMSFNMCEALKPTENSKLLIVVSDGNSGSFANTKIPKWLYTSLPVLEVDKPFPFDKPFNELNAVFWKKHIKEIVPAIMRLTGISDEDQRIFISYRRKETSEFAEQLFDRLAHEGFEVFLDRFSIEPSVNFQSRLSQELSDKAMVILLESPTYLKSKWIQYEIDFAKKHRLGLFALNIDKAAKRPAVDDEYRKEISLNAQKKLNKPKLDGLVHEIKMQHAIAIYRKRYNLYNSVNTALVSAKASPRTDSKGFINVGDIKNNIHYKIWTVARPPDVNDYHFSDTSSNTNKGVIVGPELVEEKRDTINKWLAGKSSILFFNEGQILELCDKVHP